MTTDGATSKRQPNKRKKIAEDRRKSNPDQLEKGIKSKAQSDAHAVKRRRVSTLLRSPNSKKCRFARDSHDNTPSGTHQRIGHDLESKHEHKTIRGERELEARFIAKNNITENTDSILLLIKPDLSVKALTEKIIKDMMIDVRKAVGQYRQPKDRSPFALQRAIASTRRLKDLTKEKSKTAQEADIYPLFKDFIMLAAHHVKSTAPEHNKKVVPRKNASRQRGPTKVDPYLILPYAKADFKPEGATTTARSMAFWDSLAPRT
ncbi:hypothetical protein EV175_005212 [Coemansia sp. RSA 1933]|nr:hypothetical protein EV175_005212 [Coemansia sp. RSA 1933]